MKNLLSLVIFCIPLLVTAQQFHVSIHGGVSNYQGDLQEKRYSLQQSHIAYGAGVLYEISDKLYARLNITKGVISADDKLSKKNVARNLNFTSSILDLHLGVEYHLLNLYEYRISPYVFAGFSGYHFNPYTTIAGSNTKIYLQPLGTEGQGFYQNRSKYKLYQIAIPFGGGIKFAISDNTKIGVEIGLRKLFTDYIDDISTTYVPDQASLTANNGLLATELSFRGDELSPPKQYPDLHFIRGNPESGDWYYFSVISISTRLNTGQNGRKGKYNQTSCPTF